MLSELRAVAVALATTALVVGCKPKDDKGSSSTTATAEKPAETGSASTPAGSSSAVDASTSAASSSADAGYTIGPASGIGGDKTKNTGVFQYVFAPAKEDTYKKYEPLFKEDGRLGQVVKAMGVYKLPRNVPVVSGECGTPNAMYMPSKHAIKLCYELAADWYNRFLGQKMADQEASKATLDALTFTVLHEMGHALVGELGLGISGGEEDAVDDFASLILIQNKKAEWAVLGTYALMKMGEGAPPAYFDEHSMGPQRFGNVLCLIFGSDPNNQKGIIEKVPELRPRAPKCPTTYKRADDFWTKALEPFLSR